ncbi:hypothetical protein [Estrella lausannensis]|uniref:hypothetical protein n=1 Tax=Estrella lausannensis TaxID=483423 RepID=UPI00117B5D7D|nr:hypothetical protein [Estrella lausannensis]
MKYAFDSMRQKNADPASAEMRGRMIVELRDRIFRVAVQESVEGKIDEIRDRNLRYGTDYFRPGKGSLQLKS